MKRLSINTGLSLLILIGALRRMSDGLMTVLSDHKSMSISFRTQAEEDEPEDPVDESATYRFIVVEDGYRDENIIYGSTIKLIEVVDDATHGDYVSEDPADTDIDDMAETFVDN